ncbi:NAD(P)-dependent alcohol dehydrogenase [Cohnella suwonensis]|uniref:NAD(P)-dependent alcohol dehydrogenase n=1 Tax=Cohnella suwonensis TaxID=696072 RepID=A0ABW0M1C0_9BACL
MRAAVCRKFGPPEVLEIQDVAMPVPKKNEIRIRIIATTVSAGDCRVRSFTPPPMFWLPMKFVLGFGKPRKPILGIEFAGVVDAVGSEASRFRIGDAVFGVSGFAFGTYAEYICLPEKTAIAAKPAGMTYEEAAAVPVGALTALHFLRKGKIARGSNVLVYGASGSVGTYVVQLAKYFGAKVTAVCSAANAEWVRALGADAVIDYEKESVSRSGESYDIVFDTVGKSPYSACIAMLKPKGFYLLAVMETGHVFRGLWTSMTTGKKVISGASSEKIEDLQFLGELIDEGKLVPVIDRRYPLEMIVEAHRYVDTGRKKGNVVITL